MTTPDYDFSRSFLQFTTGRVNHTPRLRIDAVCAFVSPDGAARVFVLTAACIGEKMYAQDCLVHRPPSEFLMIASADGEFMFLKRHADAANDVREAHRVGETMSTHDGRGAAMKKIEIVLAPAARARRIETYAEIREAILGNRALNGRTSYLDADGRTRIVMDYPIVVCNIPHDREMWQVDTGRVLAVKHAASGGLTVARLAPAYLVFNSWEWADLAILDAEPVGGGRSAAYSDIRRLEARNDILLLD